jgi:transposase-like protein
METPIITIKHLVNDAQCYAAIRQLRWKEGVICPNCDSSQTIRRGFASSQRHSQRYQCKTCDKRFDDLTGTVLAGHHQPLSVWVLCLYFMGLNLSNAQIAQELDLNKDDLHFMTEHLRTGIDKKKPH